MIEDVELRALFQAESEDRLNHLENGLKKLEQDLTNEKIIEDIFRDAHTIKGAARMLSIGSIEQISHVLEESLGALRRKELFLSHEIIKVYYEAIDAIRLLVEEAVQGTPASINLTALRNKLNLPHLKTLSAQIVPETGPQIPLKTPPLPSSPEATPPPSTPPSPPPEPSALPPEPSAPPDLEKKEGKESSGEISSRKEQITQRIAKQSLHSFTVRINTQQLNELLTQAGDLTVIKNRMTRLLENMEELILFWENSQSVLSQKRYTNYHAFPTELVRVRHLEKTLQEHEELIKSIGKKLNNIQTEAHEDFHKLDLALSPLVNRIRILSLVPLSKLFELFPRMVKELAEVSGKNIQFIVEGEGNLVEKRIIEEMKDPIMHILRNAIDHGIESPDVRRAQFKPVEGTIRLRAGQTTTNLIIEVSDDGKGLDAEEIKQAALKKGLYTQEELSKMSTSNIYSLIFLPGLSTATKVTEVSGRGMGMDIVKSNIEKIHGTLQIDSTPGKGCHITIQLPLSLVTTQVLMIQTGQRIYAFPIEAVESLSLISMDQVFTIEEKDVIYLQNEPISIATLSQLLNVKVEKEKAAVQEGARPCLIVKIADIRFALFVDAILDEQKVVITIPNLFTEGLTHLSGVTILKTGEVCVVLNPFDLLKSIQKETSSSLALSKTKQRIGTQKKKILVADDSKAMRMIIRKILENEGYEVMTAKDGKQAYLMLEETSFDALISDIDMPEMNGIALVDKIRKQKGLTSFPIILLTTMTRDEYWIKGKEVGANAFIVKSEFNHKILLQTLKQLLAVS